MNYFKPSKPTISVLILVALCAILFFIRIYVTGTFLGIFLVWNLFLAITPMFFILLAKKYYEFFGKGLLVNKITIYALMLVWLLFFPNSPYIITDFIHLGQLPKHLLWFDSLGIFVTALTGLSVGFYSMYNFQMLAKELMGNFTSWVILILSLILSGFGLYLGRFVRFNSWDAFSHPFWLIKKSLIETTNPLAFQTTVVFSIVLIGLYLSFYNIVSFKHESVKNV